MLSHKKLNPHYYYSSLESNSVRRRNKTHMYLLFIPPLFTNLLLLYWRELVGFMANTANVSRSDEGLTTQLDFGFSIEAFCFRPETHVFGLRHMFSAWDTCFRPATHAGKDFRPCRYLMCLQSKRDLHIETCFRPATHAGKDFRPCRYLMCLQSKRDLHIITNTI